MNRSDASSNQTVRTTLLHPADTRLHRRWPMPAWLLCLTLGVLSVGLFVASIPPYFANLHLLCTGAAAACNMYAQMYGQLTPGDMRRLQGLGFSLDFYATYTIVLVSVFALGNWVVVAFLFWRKSDDRMALLTAVSLALFPLVFNPGMNTFPLPWWFLAHGISLLGSLYIVLFFYLFPSGHFVPSFTRWVFIVALIYFVFGYFLPFSTFNPFYLSQVFNVPTYLGLLGGIVVVQIYRYRRVSSSAQRQQTKWVVYGVSLGTGGYLLLFTISLFFPLLFRTGSFVSLIEVAAAYGLGLLIPLSIGLAMLRYRLWEIDVLINRTLV